MSGEASRHGDLSSILRGGVFLTTVESWFFEPTDYSNQNSFPLHLLHSLFEHPVSRTSFRFPCRKGNIGKAIKDNVESKNLLLFNRFTLASHLFGLEVDVKTELRIMYMQRMQSEPAIYRGVSK